ncbi:hypothetical protein IEO21_09318 [Rhodonia placenta]|uniref:Uncharacterized protein n=2 Tax=Rhodonia placenta TaxID=104341 RepID=A0A1X6MN81_9APHY|nr:hypothetical protein POSPLADRAFT_1041593 [Postia placenta MAD-698-R-SB12]KAF9804650.1 hypothetical protein IEO21_09318 [Postia placenta]OSX57686.1 hypothetical protein POSPLADRAFT_1041593 [Postia placenta MAD-698-R-SB12]
MVFFLFPIVAAAIVGTAVLTSNIQHEHHMNVDLNGDSMVQRLIGELNLKDRLEQMQAKHEATMDGVAANVAQMSMNVETNLNIVTTDVHDAILFFKVFMTVLSVFYAIKTVGYIVRWIYDQRKENNVFIVLPGGGGMLGDAKVRLLGMPGLPRTVIVHSGRGRNTQ